MTSRLPDARQPVIINACRSPIGKVYGALGRVLLDQLVVPLILHLIAQSNIDGDVIDDVILGNATGGGGNIARYAALSSGLPLQVPGMVIDRQCGSGLEAINIAARLIMSGAGQFYLAGGVESVSQAPLRAKALDHQNDAPEFYNRPPFSPQHIGDPDMGIAAENVARRFNISRERQDAFAFQSYQRAMQAEYSGLFEDEIVGLQTDFGMVKKDECIRHDTSLEKLSLLKPCFDDNGTVTAGNSCPLNDGASLVLITNLEQVKKMGVENGIAFIDGVSAGVDPNILGVGPIASTQKLLSRHEDLSTDDFDLIEFNEAFASQVLASLDGLGISSDRVNLDGGALALGHPFGASGAILVTRLFWQMKHNQNAHLGLATLGTAGGMGISSLFQKVCY